MSKKQILLVRIIFILTMVIIATIFLAKGLTIKTNTSNTWLQWVYVAIAILLVGFNHFVFMISKINLIYSKYLIMKIQHFYQLRPKLIFYLIINTTLQLIFITFLIQGYTRPESIGMQSTQSINKVLFIILIAYTLVSIALTILKGINKYKYKVKVIMEAQNENK